ncbi:hypothetical protein [Mycolicibacterium sp. TY66]|uniref:hypothetical protein n=2 Tax=unclassified Mycolicibacterium TaxID=2636767 RepID=UPI001FD350C8|nr:hypothetical protein [Mycolicibacterium sp. TY66]
MMARQEPRTSPSTPAVVKGRVDKAIEFFNEAEKMLEDNQNATSAAGTLLVNAGIAASDVICCVQLGRHATGSDHQQAVSLLTKVNPDRGKDLSVLLKTKNKVSYAHERISAAEYKQLQRAASHLVEAAKLAAASAR